MPLTIIVLRDEARRHCEARGHELPIFKRVPALGHRQTANTAYKATCKLCGRHVFVSTEFPKFRPLSGRHGTAPMVDCDQKLVTTEANDADGRSDDA